MIDISLLDSVVATLGVLLTMAMFSCLCCMCMKLSDLRMKSYIIDSAKKKGIDLDLDKINGKRNCQSPLANENCTIVVPEVVYVV